MLKNLAKLYMQRGIGLYFKHSTKLMAPLQMWDLTFNPHDVIIFICFNLSLIFVVTGQKVRNKQHEILNLIKNFNSSQHPAAVATDNSNIKAFESHFISVYSCSLPFVHATGKLLVFNPRQNMPSRYLLNQTFCSHETQSFVTFLKTQKPGWQYQTTGKSPPPLHRIHIGFYLLSISEFHRAFNLETAT